MGNLHPMNFNNNRYPDLGFYNALESLFNDNFFTSRPFVNDTFKVDVKENNENYTVEAEIPGVTKDNIDLDYANGNLTIKVNREESKSQNTHKVIHKERRFSTMQRSLHLGAVNIHNINANLNNGILTVVLPKENNNNNNNKININ